MIFQESEAIELKAIVVEDIKKKIASNTAIRQMIKETDGEHFEDMRSLEQNLTFERAEREFVDQNLKFEQTQMKTLGIMTRDGIYTNMGSLLSDQCIHTIKVAVFEGASQKQFKDRKEFSGSLLQQMDDVYDFIDFRNQIHSTFDKLRRIDRRDYPELAVREAQISDNAFEMILPNLNTKRKEDAGNWGAQNGTEEESVIALAEEQGYVTRKDVEGLLDIGQTTSGRLLRRLVDSRQLARTGKGRNTRYHRL